MTPSPDHPPLPGKVFQDSQQETTLGAGDREPENVLSQQDEWCYRQKRSRGKPPRVYRGHVTWIASTDDMRAQWAALVRDLLEWAVQDARDGEGGEAT